LNNRIFVLASVAALLGAASASAQGLPFHQDSQTSQPWSVNQQASRDLDAYYNDSRDTQDRTETSVNHDLAKK
jgi:outer membrane biogenesis lipoprotein LolB